MNRRLVYPEVLHPSGPGARGPGKLARLARGLALGFMVLAGFSLAFILTIPLFLLFLASASIAFVAGILLPRLGRRSRRAASRAGAGPWADASQMIIVGRYETPEQLSALMRARRAGKMGGEEIVLEAGDYCAQRES